MTKNELKHALAFTEALVTMSCQVPSSNCCRVIVIDLPGDSSV